MARLGRGVSFLDAARTARRARGFTLIELMVVLAIVGIILAIAIPSYNAHVMRTRRQLATGCLVERAQFMERYYTTNRTYVGVVIPPQGCSTDLNQFYTLAFAAGQPTVNTFVLTATPIGAQVDEACGTLQLTNTGLRTPATGCW